jgi:hypothetical protein
MLMGKVPAPTPEPDAVNAPVLGSMEYVETSFVAVTFAA